MIKLIDTSTTASGKSICRKRVLQGKTAESPVLLSRGEVKERDAKKRIKLVRLPLVLWQVGTIMAFQLVTPMMEPVRDYFTATGDKVTQEAVQAKMDDMKLMRKMERELLAEEEEVSVWKLDKNGRRYWESGKSYDQEAGVVLEELVKETGKLPQTIISEALLLMVDGGVSVSRLVDDKILDGDDIAEFSTQESGLREHQRTSA
jgi:hypothetical protein